MSTYIRIDLDDIDTDDLIDELGNRYLDNSEQLELLNLVRDNYDDSGKLKIFLKNINRFSVLDLEKMFADIPEPAVAGKNQIPLFNNNQP